MKKTATAFNQLELARVLYEESLQLELKTNTETETISKSKNVMTIFYEVHNKKVFGIIGQTKEEKLKIERIGK